MGWVYRRRVRLGKNAWLNISKRGVSESVRMGPVTFNSRGRRSVRVAKGLSYRSGCALPLMLLLSLAAAAAAAATASKVTMSDDERPKGYTVFGRSGSPTITLALPFSRVEVSADDAAPHVAELAGLVARLARAMASGAVADELEAIAADADGLAARISASTPAR